MCSMSTGPSKKTCGSSIPQGVWSEAIYLSFFSKAILNDPYHHPLDDFHPTNLDSSVSPKIEDEHSAPLGESHKVEDFMSSYCSKTMAAGLIGFLVIASCATAALAQTRVSVELPKPSKPAIPTVIAWRCSMEFLARSPARSAPTIIIRATSRGAWPNVGRFKIQPLG